MNKRTLLVIAAIVVLGLGALGVKIPQPIANILQQAGVDVPASVMSNDAQSPQQPKAVDNAGKPESSQIAGDFREAKRWLYEVHGDHRIDFYCGCGFDKSRRKIDSSECGYKVQEDRIRGGRIEAEHVISASWLGKPRACWEARNCKNSRGETVNGRDCCLATDDGFREAHNDLHNLQPTIGELNKHRSSYPFGEVRGEPRKYGRCDFEVDRRVEPPPEVRGDIARTAFYMRDRYGVELRGSQAQQLEKWAEADPVDQWERQRNERIARKQGLSNPYITEQ